MKRSLAFLLLLVPALLAQGTQRLTYEDTTKKPIAWSGPAPVVRWAWDEKHVETETDGKKVWIDPQTGAVGDVLAEPTKVAREEPAKDGPRRPVLRNGVLFLVAGAEPAARSRRRGAQPQAAAPGNDEGERIAEVGKVLELHGSADASAVSFVRGNNLVVLDTKSKQEWAVTTDGGPDMFHGYLDWVYQEEVYGRGNFQGHWWSPAGATMAFLTLDEAPVKEFTIVNHVPPGFLDQERAVTTEVSNYPKAGDPNPFARVSIAHAKSKQVVKVDLAAWPKDVIVARVEWTPDGGTLLLTLQDRIQTIADLVAVEVDTGKTTTWIHEQSTTWVNRPDSPRWLADGTFLWNSERTGYNHVYRYQKGGKLLSAITSGDWQVRSIERLDEKRGVLWFEGTKDGAVDRNVYRVDFDGKNLARLTPGAGTHQLDFNHDASFGIDRWSAMDRPTTVRLCSGKDGQVVKEFGQASKGAAKDYAFAEKQRVTIQARDGFPLDASVMRPVDFDPTKKYPVLLPTYSGPDAASVRDAWGHSTREQFLCQQGFVILQVNVRSASGKGHRHIGTCYQQLGVQELKDLEDAVDYVCKQHGGDPTRVAIQGWSYGGFMTAYALTHSQKFALGLAGAGVYDWRLYDSIYTERYMRTPQENKAGYDATSVIKAAKQLHGHLVLIHGTMDDNVHLQNTMQLLWELEKANKQNFELMLYPRSQHGLAGEVGAHERDLEWRKLQQLQRGEFKDE